LACASAAASGREEENMDKERLFRTGFAIFWLVALGLLVLDTASSSNIRVEPPPIALGSGQAASGGHCSGR